MPRIRQLKPGNYTSSKRYREKQKARRDIEKQILRESETRKGEDRLALAVQKMHERSRIIAERAKLGHSKSLTSEKPPQLKKPKIKLPKFSPQSILLCPECCNNTLENIGIPRIRQCSHCKLLWGANYTAKEFTSFEVNFELSYWAQKVAKQQIPDWLSKMIAVSQKEKTCLVTLGKNILT